MTALKSRDGMRRVQRVAPLRLPARDEVEALVELREQARDLGGVVLQVAVDRDDDVAAAPPRSRPARAAALPKLRRRRTTRTLSCARVQPRQRGEGAVARAVVDEDGLPRLARAARARLRAPRSRSATLRSSSCTGMTTEITACSVCGRWQCCSRRRGARARARARPAARGRARRRSRRRPAGCSPRTSRAASTCRPSRAPRWTATRSGRRTRPAGCPSSADRRRPAGRPAARARGGDGDRDRRRRARGCRRRRPDRACCRT